MSPALINAWNKELRSLVQSSEIKQKLSGLRLEVQTSTPQEFHDRQLRCIVSFTAPMKAAGLQPE